MDVILIKKNLGDAKMFAVCTFLLGLPGTGTSVYIPQNSITLLSPLPPPINRIQST